jgi:solute:Na+ symporter, SSS family
MIFGLHWIDALIITAYFLITLYIGVYRGGKKTKSLGDFYVAGGKWGAAVSFIFIFASAIAGNEAVVVGGQAYESGLSGVWYWWSFLFATPVYFIFATYFRRARVYNISEFLEMRYDKNVSAFYSLIAGIICILFIGMFLLAIAKIITSMTAFSVSQCVWIITFIVAAYVFTGGMMSTLLTDIFQGLLILVILCFVMLPFLLKSAGGWSALQEYSLQKPEIWNLVDPEKMSIWTILALNLSALVGGIAAPWIYNWISVSKNERAATQCAWGHLWKRLITLLFAFYGILFAIYKPGIEDPESSWGIVMQEILPVGVIGLLIVSFFAAAMSSAGSYATTSSAMFANYFYRKMIAPMRSSNHHLLVGRFTALLSLIVAAGSTIFIGSIKEYVKLSLTLLCFIGVPIYFGVLWKKSNLTGMWMSLIAGVIVYIITVAFTMTQYHVNFVEAINPSFEHAVFFSTAASLLGMIIGSFLGKPTNMIQLKRFYVIMNTPVGEESRLIKAGISLPSLIDSGFIGPEKENINVEVLEELYHSDSADKFFGRNSNIELRREKQLPWYYSGFFKIIGACVALVAGTWFIARILFIW